jgi:hypothetical protein
MDSQSFRLHLHLGSCMSPTLIHEEASRFRGHASSQPIEVLQH